MSQNPSLVPLLPPRSNCSPHRGDASNGGLSAYRTIICSNAPCGNRIHNLMIKSQLQGDGLARTEGVYLGFQATNDAELVPPVDPNNARQFHATSVYSHGLITPRRRYQ